MAKIISVIGSPGSGKTTVALKLAQELYCSTSNGAVIYLSPSLKVPALGVLFPNYKPDSVFSLGAMFDKTDIFEEDVLNHLITVKAMNNFGCPRPPLTLSGRERAATAIKHITIVATQTTIS